MVENAGSPCVFLHVYIQNKDSRKPKWFLEHEFMGECSKVDMKSKLTVAITFIIARSSSVHVIPKAKHAISNQQQAI